MIKWSYNGTVLPVLPGGYQYAIISYQPSSDRYYLLYTDSGFGDIGGTTCFLSTANYLAYTCIAWSVQWIPTQLNIDSGGQTFTGVDKTTNLIWSNSDIIDLVNSTTDNYVYAYTGSDPVEYIAADMPAASFGWSTGEGSTVTEVTSISLPQGKPPSKVIALLGVAPDGGNVYVQWYRDGTLVATENDDSSIIYSIYTPSTENIESYELQCYVFNSYNDTVTAGTTHKITVSIVEDISISIDPVALSKGYLVGCYIRAMMHRLYQPIAYLYNGVRLPKLPEWDKEIYPYAYIHDVDFIDIGRQTVLIITNVPYKYGTITGMHEGSAVTLTLLYNHVDEGETGILVYYGLIDNSWKLLTRREWSDGYEIVDVNDVIEGDDNAQVLWANEDIINSDTNGMYFEASEPIPVYE